MEDYIQFSDVKVGQRVKFKDSVPFGIISGIRAQFGEWDSEKDLSFFYLINKIKKDGTMSQHAVYWSGRLHKRDEFEPVKEPV